MKKNIGFTLLEVLLVLTVVAILGGLTVRYFLMVNRSEKIARTVQQIKLLSKASYEWLQSAHQVDFSSGNPISITALFDADLISADDEKNVWGGDITVAPSIDPSRVSISLMKVPPEMCLRLRQKMEGIAHRQTIKEGCTLRRYVVEI